MGLKIIVLTALFVVLLNRPANAYLDPGTGSLMLQALIGTIAAGAAAIGIYWQKVKALLRRGKDHETDKK